MWTPLAAARNRLQAQGSLAKLCIQPPGKAMTDDDTKLEGLACFAIYAASHAFNRAYKPLLDTLGLTYPQYLVMVVLWEEDAQTVGQLGQRLCLESSTLTPLLKRLETAGQVSRERDAADERQVRVRLTPAGKSLRVKARKVPPCILRASGRSAESLRRLSAELEQLRAALDQSQR